MPRVASSPKTVPAGAIAPAQCADQADEKSSTYGKEYRYAHDESDTRRARTTFEGMPPVEWYQPVDRGLEIKIGEKMAHLRELDRAAAKKPGIKKRSGHRD